MKILLFGVSNVGKTTAGRILADKLEYDFYDLDARISKLERQVNRLENRINELEGNKDLNSKTDYNYSNNMYMV